MKRIILITMLLMLIPFSAHGATIVGNTQQKEYLNKCIDKIPAGLVEDHDGIIYVVDHIEYESLPGITGLYWHQSHNILIDDDDLEIIYHEFGHYIYYKTEWSMELASAYAKAKADYHIIGYEDLGRYDYDSEVFAFLFDDYIHWMMTKERHADFEHLLILLEKEN